MKEFTWDRYTFNPFLETSAMYTVNYSGKKVPATGIAVCKQNGVTTEKEHSSEEWYMVQSA